MFERRIRSVLINPEVILAFFQDWKSNNYLTVANVEGIPHGCQVVAVFAEEQPCAIRMHVYHPSFAIVQPGMIPPPLFDGPAPMSFVKLRHGVDYERGQPAFLVGE